MATIRQKQAFKEVLNGSTISGAMVKAGYAETTASTTGKLTNTKGWQELMDQHLPDSKLAKRHREMLDKRETIVVRDGKESHVELTEQPHSDVSKALDMAYKLKGKYPREESFQDGTKIILMPLQVINRYDLRPHPSPAENNEQQG